MRAVAWTDTHLGINGLDYRMTTMLNSFIRQAVEQYHPDVAICLGDVFNSKKPAANIIEYAVQWFRAWAESVGTVIIIPGNHDIDAFSGSSAVDYLDDISSNIMVFSEPTEYMDMLFVPYHRNLTPDVRKMIARYPQVFLHQGYTKAPLYGSRLYGDKPDALSNKELASKDLALIGHIHTPLYLPDSRVYLLGAPYQIRYADALLERSFGVWTMENPSDFRLVPFAHNYYLQKIDLVVQAGNKAVDELVKMLPSRAENYYYQVNVAVEGGAMPKQITDMRRSIQELFGDSLDGSSVISIQSKSNRQFFTELKRASLLKEAKAPQEMLAIHMKNTNRAYYEANPELYQGVLDEFADIVKAVEEVGKK